MSVGVECGSGFSNEEILNVRFPLHRACRDGDVGALCALLQRCTDTVHLNAEDSVYGWSPIHWAAHFGKLECVMRLVQVGCEVNAVTTKFAQTPAHIAAFGGHPDCVLWLLQAGADVNRQDYVGETPIHKAARAGSMECIKALLLQGAKPHLRNASGLTAADLAHAQGFHECSQLLTNAQNHLIQLNGFHANGTLNGNTNLCPGQGLPSRKRLLNDTEAVHVKKARTDGVDVSMRMLQNGGGGGGDGDDPESMHVEESMHSEDDPKAMSNGHSVPNSGSTTANGHYDAATPRVNGVNGSASSSDGVLSARWNSTTAPPPHRRPAKSELSLPLRREESWSGQTTTTTAAAPRCPTDMCGSLHLTESPSSCVAYRPAWGGAMGSDGAGDSLHYGHYHGFGDTAEDLTESTGSRLEHSFSVYAEQHYNQAMVNNFHGS